MKDFGLTIYQISNFLYKLIALNILILLFSIIGLIFLGFFPSLAAGYAILRNWLIFKKEPPLIREFFNYYKLYFIKSNLLGYLFTIAIAFFYFDFYFFQSLSSPSLRLVSYLYLPLLFLAVITAMYVFPLFVHYQLKMSTVIKNSFLLAIGNPFTTILILVIIGGIMFVLYFIPMLFVFIGISSICYTTMYFSQLLFEKSEKKMEDFTS